MLLFRFSEETTPINDIVLILVVEDHLRVDKVFNDLLTAAVLQKFRPLGLYTHALLVVVGQRVNVEVVVGPHVNVEASSREEDSEDDHSVDSISDYGAFTEAEVPDLLFEIVGEAEAALLSHALEAATAAMHRIFGQEKEDWQDDEAE